MFHQSMSNYAKVKSSAIVDKDMYLIIQVHIRFLFLGEASWTAWQTWTKCSSTSSCTIGFKKRERACKTSTVPGEQCDGLKIQIQPCFPNNYDNITCFTREYLFTFINIVFII